MMLNIFLLSTLIVNRPNCQHSAKSSWPGLSWEAFQRCPLSINIINRDKLSLQTLYIYKFCCRFFIVNRQLQKTLSRSAVVHPVQLHIQLDIIIGGYSQMLNIDLPPGWPVVGFSSAEGILSSESLTWKQDSFPSSISDAIMSSFCSGVGLLLL